MFKTNIGQLVAWSFLKEVWVGSRCWNMKEKWRFVPSSFNKRAFGKVGLGIVEKSRTCDRIVAYKLFFVKYPMTIMKLHNLRHIWLWNDNLLLIVPNKKVGATILLKKKYFCEIRGIVALVVVGRVWGDSHVGTESWKEQ